MTNDEHEPVDETCVLEIEPDELEIQRAPTREMSRELLDALLEASIDHGEQPTPGSAPVPA